MVSPPIVKRCRRMLVPRRYLEERRTHSTVVNQLESDLKQAKQKQVETESEVKEWKHKFSEEQSEWKQLHVSILPRYLQVQTPVNLVNLNMISSRLHDNASFDIVVLITTKNNV